MPETRYSEVYDRHGNLINQEPYEVSDQQLAAEQDELRTCQLLLRSNLNKTELTELGRLIVKRFSLDITPTVDPALASTHWAQVDSFTIGNEKPLRVRRNWHGNDVFLDCYVTEEIKDTYLGGNLNVGDIVIVSFVDEEIDTPVVLSKVYRSW